MQLCTSADHLNKTVVILAGYKAPMDLMLKTTNPGIRSRFTARLEFNDWRPEDCLAAIEARCETDGLLLGSGSSAHVSRVRANVGGAADSDAEADDGVGAGVGSCAVRAALLAGLTEIAHRPGAANARDADLSYDLMYATPRHATTEDRPPPLPQPLPSPNPYR